jgi:hypothetical protein
LKDVTLEDAERRIEPMNSISWIVGHMAWQEQAYWLTHAQGITVAPAVNKVASGAPASVPPLAEMWEAWYAITKASDEWLDSLTSDMLKTHSMHPDGVTPYKESIGSRLQRTTYHYWYHIGESQAIRQLLGHTGLPSFVGDMHGKAPYTPEED